MDDMTDEEFIRYCETHCDTPRAGFVPQNIVRILRLAGKEALAATWKDADPRSIVSIGPSTMLPMCRRAREILKEPRNG